MILYNFQQIVNTVINVGIVWSPRRYHSKWDYPIAEMGVSNIQRCMAVSVQNAQNIIAVSVQSTWNCMVLSVQNVQNTVASSVQIIQNNMEVSLQCGSECSECQKSMAVSDRALLCRKEHFIQVRNQSLPKENKVIFLACHMTSTTNLVLQYWTQIGNSVQSILERTSLDKWTIHLDNGFACFPYPLQCDSHKNGCLQETNIFSSVIQRRTCNSASRSCVDLPCICCDFAGTPCYLHMAIKYEILD